MRLHLPTIAAVVASATATAVLVALGVWQLQRHEWKQGVVAERTARMEAAPAAAAALAALLPEETDYRRAEATGDWDFEHAMVLANRGRNGVKGEELLVPLLLAPGGPAVLVNRGWYPEDARADVLQRLAAQPLGPVSGLARYVLTDGSRQIESGAWTRLDPLAMGEALPYPVLPWVLIEGEMLERTTLGDGTWPLQGYPPFRNTVPHIEYAVTWFGLAVALVAVAFVRLFAVPRRERRLRRAPGAAPPEMPGAR
jgi:surfeit locus 1 family protein